MAENGLPRWTRRRARNWFIASTVGVLSLAGGYLLSTGALAPKVVVGRNWPQVDWVGFDQVDHRSWDALLQRYVDKTGLVDYAAWKSSTGDIAALDDYLMALSRTDPHQVASRDARLAFWINAYNAVTVRGILREYPTLSIQDHAPWLWGYNIWRDLLLCVGDKSYSLAEIEHGLLRPLHEPRIHFAIVCASRGCPRLLNRAYTAAGLEQQLQENSRTFFADPSKFEYDGSELRLSPILSWYADDFGATPDEILQSIAPYLPDNITPPLISNHNLQVSYLDYDWRLNDQALIWTDAPLPPDFPFVGAEDSRTAR